MLMDLVVSLTVYDKLYDNNVLYRCSSVSVSDDTTLLSNRGLSLLYISFILSDLYLCVFSFWLKKCVGSLCFFWVVVVRGFEHTG